MNMRTIFPIAAVVLLAAASVSGQSCPTIKASGPYDAIKRGTSVTFTASIIGGRTKVSPTFNWTISAGIITSGQGTSSITVDTTGVEGTITATVEVRGYDRKCVSTSSFSAETEMPPTPRQTDEFGGVIPSEINGKLDNFFIGLGNDPTATGYVIAYPTKAAPAAARAFLKRTIDQARARGIDPSRIKTFAGAIRKVLLIQLWIVPQGAQAPKIGPTKPQMTRSPAARKTP